MASSPTEQIRTVFSHLCGLVRTAGLYPPAHQQTRLAGEALLTALVDYLDRHGTLTFRFLGDVLVANDRILSRESVVHRRFLQTWQHERKVGSISFTAGVERREVEALLEALTAGVGSSLPAWLGRKALVHVMVGPPIEPDRKGGEVVARRAYYGSVEVLREIETTIRARAPISFEQIGSLRVFSSALLEQIVRAPELALRLASIKSYDEYTLYHSVNVAVLSIGLGLVIGLPTGLLRDVAVAGMLHDLGKIAVPLEILRKPGPLDEHEWQVMRRHPVLGASLLARLPGANRLPMIVAFEHHMRVDGRGYPAAGRSWSQHPISRLACAADVFDAMTSRRAYKTAIPTSVVCAYVRSEADRIFDQRLAQLLERLLGELARRGHSGEAA